MNDHEFDRLTRSATQGLPRRRVLKALAGGLLGAALARLGAEQAAAGGCLKDGKACKRERQCCSGVCRGGTCRHGTLEVGDGCDPGRPEECRSGRCGCMEPGVGCTCRIQNCLAGQSSCGAATDCCDGVCRGSSTGPHCYAPKEWEPDWDWYR